MRVENRINNKDCRQCHNINTDETQRLANFNRAVLFGPIFTCSCCSRMLYENGVILITQKFREKVDEKKAGYYISCIPHETVVDIIFNGSNEKTGPYICHTSKQQ